MKITTGTRVLVLALLMAMATACAPSHTGPRARYVVPTPQGAATECKPDTPTRKWAVVVGINAYSDERITNLKGAVTDAWAFYHYLASPKGGAIPEIQMKIILDKDATRDRVVDALGNFLGQACPRDEVMIYFAGHGSPEPRKPQDAFLLVHNTNLDNLVGTALSMKKLPDFLKWRAEKVGNLVMILDACHSGAVQFPGQRGALVAERIKGVTESVDEVTGGNKGWGAISAAASDQFAQETDSGWVGCRLGGVPYPGGLFTCHLIRGLSGAADADADGTVSLDELHKHLSETVGRDSKGMQSPQLSGSLDRDMAIGNPSEQPIAIPPVPKRFTEDEESSVLVPFLWVGAGLSAATLTTGAVFNIKANGLADEINAGIKPGAQAKADHDQFQQLAVVSYFSAGLVGALSLAGLIFELLDEPQGIEDVYELPPWLQISIAPTPKGPQSSLNLHFEW